MLNTTNLNSSNSLFIVIVNYRTSELTIDCLQSLKDEVVDLPSIKVMIIDNASGDDSVEKIQAAIQAKGWDEWASIISLNHNGGFAFGNNAAIRMALKSDNPPSYFLLLNPDTIVRPNAIKVLIDFMNQNQQVGIAGSRLEDPDGTPQRSAFRFPSLLSEFDSGLRLGFVSQVLSKWLVAPPISEETCSTDWVAGASMIIRREVFEQVGLMDESYFMYSEETDFCLQAKKAGWSCWYVPQSRVIHLVGQSSGVNTAKEPRKRLPKYVFDSRRRYFLKNHGWFYTALADHIWSSSYLLWRLTRIIQGKPSDEPTQLLFDFLCNSFVCKGGKYDPPRTL